MDARAGDSGDNESPGPAHEDLRDLIERFETMGEVAHIEDADSHLELSALCELVTVRHPGAEPAILFERIKGFEPGYRILSGASNSFKRLAVVLGVPVPEQRLDIVKSYRARMKKGAGMIPPRVLSSGPVLENVLRDDEVDLTRFPAPFVHELDGGRYI